MPTLASDRDLKTCPILSYWANKLPVCLPNCLTARRLRRARSRKERAMSDSPKVFRVTLEVADLEYATQLYGDLFGQDGQRHPGARHYFDCGGVIVAILDVSRGGMPPTPGPKSLFFAVDDVDAVHARAERLRRPPP